MLFTHIVVYWCFLRSSLLLTTTMYWFFVAQIQLKYGGIAGSFCSNCSFIVSTSPLFSSFPLLHFLYTPPLHPPSTAPTFYSITPLLQLPLTLIPCSIPLWMIYTMFPMVNTGYVMCQL